MSEAYVECLVKRKGTVKSKVLTAFLASLTLVTFLTITLFALISLVLAAALGVATYFAWLQTAVEYEYLYLDKEITIDKVLARTKRKRVATFDLNRIEIIAPVQSYHLDNYKNRQVKVKDFSSGENIDVKKRFVFYYEGGVKVVFDPNQKMIDVLRNVAPRKVFVD